MVDSESAAVGANPAGAPYRSWSRRGIAVLAWAAAAGCAYLSAWALILMPRAVDMGPTLPFGTAMAAVGLLGLAIAGAGALFARGALLLRAAPRSGHGARAAYGALALGGALTALPAARWLWLTLHACWAEQDDTLYSFMLEVRAYPALWLEWSSWAATLLAGGVAVVAWWRLRRSMGDPDAEIPVHSAAARAPLWAAGAWAVLSAGLGTWGGTAWVSDPYFMLSTYDLWEGDAWCGNGGGGGPVLTPEEQRAAVASVRRVVRGNYSPIGRLLAAHDDHVSMVAAAWSSLLGHHLADPAQDRWIGLPVRFANTDSYDALGALPETRVAAAAVPELLQVVEADPSHERHEAALRLIAVGRWSSDVVPALEAMVLTGWEADRAASEKLANPLEWWPDAGSGLLTEEMPSRTLIALAVIHELARHPEREDARTVSTRLARHESRWLRAAVLMELVQHLGDTFDRTAWDHTAAWAFEALEPLLRDSDPEIVERALHQLVAAPWFKPAKLLTPPATWAERLRPFLQDPATPADHLEPVMDCVVRMRHHAIALLPEVCALARSHPDLDDICVETLVAFRRRAAGRELLAMLEHERLRGEVLEAAYDEMLHRTGAPGSLHPEDLVAAINAAQSEADRDLMLDLVDGLGVLPEPVRRALMAYGPAQPYPDAVWDVLWSSYPEETADADRPRWLEAIALDLAHTKPGRRGDAAERLSSEWAILPAALRARLRAMVTTDPDEEVRERVQQALIDEGAIDPPPDEHDDG